MFEIPIFRRPSALVVRGWSNKESSTALVCDGCGGKISFDPEKEIFYSNGKMFCNKRCCERIVYALNGWGL